MSLYNDDAAPYVAVGVASSGIYYADQVVMLQIPIIIYQGLTAYRN